ncbi:MAG: hypothetical protein LPJ92_11955 [Rhodobacterales bacterium]|nr:hypothetical protein [Rhodobacterales bacterium]MDX5391049.1 hypothetical protein [Rhodobacterales bacterium]MDX5490744.1 hypothetical protein [Rhodobacterales bacterium]
MRPGKASRKADPPQSVLAKRARDGYDPRVRGLLSLSDLSLFPMTAFFGVDSGAGAAPRNDDPISGGRTDLSAGGPG